MPLPGFEPFLPTAADQVRLASDVAAVPELQRAMLAAAAGLKIVDRLAHQYQIAGGRVTLAVNDTLPTELAGLGLFVPGARHVGVGRISTGLGCPHAETDPDFLGLRASFADGAGCRTDFIAINHPTSPTDTHPEFMALLAATVAAAEAGGGWPAILRLAPSNLALLASLVHDRGVVDGTSIAAHVLSQTLPTAQSESAMQRYWTGIVMARERPGKFEFVPLEINAPPHEGPRAQRLTHDWAARLAVGPITFAVDWLPYIDQDATPTQVLTQAWATQPVRVAMLHFEASDSDWAELAQAMRATPAHWVTGADDGPGTEFAAARALAYALSQAGRDALPEDDYAAVFRTGVIDAALAARLRGRHVVGHIDRAPDQALSPPSTSSDSPVI